MAATGFDLIQADDEDLNRVQRNVAKALRGLLLRPWAQGIYLSGKPLAGGGAATLVEHGLGRKLVDYFLLSQNAQADVWTDQATNPNPELTLRLRASAAVTVSLIVF